MSNRVSNAGLSLTTAGATILSAEHPTGDLFYLSSSAVFADGKAVRGGVPIIAPGFSTLLGEPKHGWARISEWEVSKTDDGFRAELAHDGIVLGLDAIYDGATLRMRLTAESTLAESTRVQLGFHPYFRVSHVEEVSLEGLGDEAITVSGEFDEIFPVTGPVTIRDAHRTLTIEATGHDSTVVWNPGEKAADALPDLAPREWSRFVCVEPMLLGSEQQGTVLSPGEIITLEFTVTVSD